MLRKFIKSKVSEQTRKGIRRRIDAVKSLWIVPMRRWRALGLDSRFPFRPEGRKWSSNIEIGLHESFQRGLIAYTYRGIPMLKHPIEIAHYMRLVWQLRPGTIFEVGSNAGGSAIWLGDLLETYNIDGRVLSLDIKVPSPPIESKLVTFMKGDAGDLGVVLTDDLLSSLPRPWLVIEDASHQYVHTLAVLRFFSSRMRSGEYVIVEDGNVAEMGDDARFDGGPSRAVMEFLQEANGAFRIDAEACDWYGYNVTGNPNGYLVRA